MKIHIATSGVPRAGYANVNPAGGWDHRVADLAFCEDAEAVEILAPDYLDFVPADAVADTLALWRRKLRMGGLLVVGGLDLREVARRLARGQIPLEAAQALIYGPPAPMAYRRRQSGSRREMEAILMAHGLAPEKTTLDEHHYLIHARRPSP